MDTLPGELKAALALHLHPPSIVKFSQTSKAINGALKQENFWKQLYSRDYQLNSRHITAGNWNSIYQQTYTQHMQWLNPKGKLHLIHNMNIGHRVVCSTYDPVTRSAFTGGWDMPVQEYKIGDDYSISLVAQFEVGAKKDAAAAGYWSAFSGSSSVEVSDQLVISGLYSGELMIFDRKERTLLRKLAKKDLPGTHELRSVQFDNEKIICASEDRYLKVWDTETGALLQHFQDPDQGKCWVAKYDNASHLCLYGNSKSKVCAVDMRTWTVVQSFETGVNGEGVKSLHFDDEKILCGTMSGTSHIFDWNNARLFDYENKKGLNYVEQVYFDPFKIVVGDFHFIHAFDPKTYQLLNKSPLRETRGISIQPEYAVVGYSQDLGVLSMKIEENAEEDKKKEDVDEDE
jgi:WD40 repeat protein